MRRTFLCLVFAAIATIAMAEIKDFKKAILIYPKGAPDSNGLSGGYTSGSGWYKVDTAKLYIYLPKTGTTKGTVLVIPGGGYGMIAYTSEGMAVAKKLVNDGWAAAVLKYRLPNGHDSIPLRDACRAMELLKDSATQWGLNPDGKFGVAGFSAGGHLASTLVTKFITEKSRPDFGVLTYPVITLESGKTHNGTRINLLGNSPSKEKERAWCTNTQVTRNTPPCLLVLCQDDATVPTLSSVLMYNALCDSSIYADMVIVPKGGHGWGASGSELVQRDVVEDAVFKFIDSTVIASSPVSPYPSSPSRLSPVASSRIYLYGSGEGYLNVYEPKSFCKSMVLSLLGTDEQVSRFTEDNYKVFVLSCRPGVSEADSLADVEKAMQILRQMQQESGLDCAVGCLAKEGNAAFAVKILTQTESNVIRPDFGVLYSPDLEGLDISQMVTNATPPCIIIGSQEDKNVKLMTDFYMAMTTANRRECELVLTRQQTTKDLALKRFLEDKFYTKSSSMRSSVAAMADQLGWGKDALPGTLQFNSIISLTNENPTSQCKYDTETKGLRFYQWCGSFTIKARKGATIKYIKLTYSAFDDNKKGVIIKNWGTDGYDYPEDAKIESGKTYVVDADSIQLWAGSLGPKDGDTNRGKVNITGFEIVYEDPTSVIDSYMSLTTKSDTTDVPFNGDGNIYSWKVKNYKREASDKSDYVNNSLGIRLKYNSTTSEGYLAMNGAQEGGVKDISFDYHTLNTTMPIHFLIKNGSTTLDEFSHVKAADVNYVYNYTKELNIQSNAALSIVMPKQETPQQTYITMGPVTITPYLLYKTKMVTLQKEDLADVRYKYTNKDLLDNTNGGDITYSVIGANADKVASVNAKTGEVTVKGEGVVKVQAKWGNVTTSYQLTVFTKEPGFHKVACTVTELAKKYNWVNGDDNNCYLYFQLNDIISVKASSGNSKYLNSIREKECLRFYQGSNKGQFTIRAKAGVIIQSIKLDYHNAGVVTTDYGTDGTKIPADKQVKSGVPFKVDGNVINLYVGSTDAESGKQVRIENFEVTYFIPETGATVTKSAYDLGKQHGLKNDTPYHDVTINNALRVHTDDDGTFKYYSTTGNFNCYRWMSKPIQIIAREGAKIHYVKVTYETGATGTLTRNYGKDGKNIPASDRIASDSIIYVNADKLELWVGNTNGTDATVAIKKIYVNYTDNAAIVENFDKCTVANTTGSTDVTGTNGLYDWRLTNYNRDSTHRIYYDQSIMLRTDKESKIETLGEEGGFKEISFDWFVSDKSKRSKFTVKAGDMTDVVDSAAMSTDSYKITYTKTGIKSNGTFSISMATGSATYTYMEFGAISLTPYLLFRTREDTVYKLAEASYDVHDYLLDNTEDANNISYTIESDGTGGAAISGSVVDLTNSTQDGAIALKATWGSVYTTMTLQVKVNDVPPTPTNISSFPSGEDRGEAYKVMVNGQLRIYKDGKCYSVLGQKMSK